MIMKMLPIPPFDFDLSASIFAEGDKRFQRYETGRFWQVLRYNGRLLLASIRSIGTVEEPELLISFGDDKVFANGDKGKLEEIIGTLFNLKINLEIFYKAMKGDKIMSTLTSRLRGLKSPSTTTAYEALVYAIIEQQISLRAARSIQKKLIEAFGEILEFDGNDYYAFPTPQILVSKSIDQLRDCGLSGRKAEYILGVSRLIVNGLDLEGIKCWRDDNQVIEELCKIRGVGVWTAEMAMIRGMQRFDSIPADDLGLRRCKSNYYCDSRMITGREARQIAEFWRGWRGLASFYLITAERPRITV